MTASDATPSLGELATLPGLETVTGQLAPLIAVLRAEQARRQAGITIRRPAWKNLVFTGGPGTGKSRAASALTRLYRDLGLLRHGQLIDIAAADLAGTTPRDTATQVAQAVKPTGDLLLITDAHTWHALPDRGQHVLRCLYQQMAAARKDYESQPDELAIIMSGQPGPLRASPALAARFPAVIDFPGYTPGQLTAILNVLAAEAGLTLTPGAQAKAATVLAQAETGHASGNARLAARMLTQATTSQARRLTTAPHTPEPAALATISAADIPAHLPPDNPLAHDQPPGQYL